MYKLVSLNFKITMTFCILELSKLQRKNKTTQKHSSLADHIKDCAIFFETLVITVKTIVILLAERY